MAKTLVEFLAEPVKGEPDRHHMTMTIDGVRQKAGVSLDDRSARQLVNEFQEKFPHTEIIFIDRTVQ